MHQNQTESKPADAEQESGKGLDGTPCCVSLKIADRRAISEILGRRANDIATFKYDLEKSAGKTIDAFPGSVEMALSREIKRLRRLADLVKPPAEPQDDDEE